MRVRIIGPEHLGQVCGRIATLLALNKTFKDDIAHLRSRRGALPNSQSPIAAVMGRWWRDHRIIAIPAPFHFAHFWKVNDRLLGKHNATKPNNAWWRWIRSGQRNPPVICKSAYRCCD